MQRSVQHLLDVVAGENDLSSREDFEGSSESWTTVENWERV